MTKFLRLIAGLRARLILFAVLSVALLTALFVGYAVREQARLISDRLHPGNYRGIGVLENE